MFKEVLDFEYLTISEAKEILENIVKERRKVAEVGFETRKTLQYLRTLSKLPAKKARELVEELLELPFVSEVIAIKIADILPDIPDEVRLLYAKEGITLSPEEIQTILDIVEKYKS
uniref:DNA-directed RNA polymerase subunit Rpo4 n=1 Tax=Geoglobus ahangari TaxID=113653 RepID=A0A7C3YEY7_9EURY